MKEKSFKSLSGGDDGFSRCGRSPFQNQNDPLRSSFSPGSGAPETSAPCIPSRVAPEQQQQRQHLLTRYQARRLPLAV